MLMGVDSTIKSLPAQGGDINEQSGSAVKVRELGDGERLEGAAQTLPKGDSGYYLEPTAATRAVFRDLRTLRGKREFQSAGEIY